MSEHPEDVMKAAREAVAEAWENSGDFPKSLAGSIRLGEKDGMLSVQIAARAILQERFAEREKCAQIADAHSECERDCGDVIAAAIRRTGP